MSAEKKNKHRGAFFMEGVPESTRESFKSACALRRRSMKSVLIEFMQEFEEKTYKELGLRRK